MSITACGGELRLYDCTAYTRIERRVRGLGNTAYHSIFIRQQNSPKLKQKAFGFAGSIPIGGNLLSPTQ
jgi:hypothetical protein